MKTHEEKVRTAEASLIRLSRPRRIGFVIFGFGVPMQFLQVAAWALSLSLGFDWLEVIPLVINTVILFWWALLARNNYLEWKEVEAIRKLWAQLKQPLPHGYLLHVQDQIEAFCERVAKRPSLWTGRC